VFYLNCPPTQLLLINAGVHELLWECAHIQLEIVHDLTFGQQGVYFPACFRASSSCNMWDQSIEKLIKEVEKQPPLYLKSIENWNGLTPEERKN
jgi:hypothetical protein